MVQTIQASPRLLLPLANSAIRGDTSDDHGVVAVTLNHTRIWTVTAYRMPIMTETDNLMRIYLLMPIMMVVEE
jgi:hypothetical protein